MENTTNHHTLTQDEVDAREKQALVEAMQNLKSNALTEPLPPFVLSDDAIIQGEVHYEPQLETSEGNEINGPADYKQILKDDKDQVTVTTANVTPAKLERSADAIASIRTVEVNTDGTLDATHDEDSKKAVTSKDSK